MRIPAHVQNAPAATAESVEDAESALGAELPTQLRELYALSDGLSTAEGVVLYATSELAERNQTLEVSEYAPGHVAVGDDSGGRALLISERGDARWVDMGSMDPSGGQPLGLSFADWIEAGLPLARREEDETPSHVDVYLERAPAGGLESLVFVKTQLELELSSRELLALSKSPPVRLQRSVPYGKALVRARRVNAKHDCVSLRVVDQPDRRVLVAES